MSLLKLSNKAQSLTKEALSPGTTKALLAGGTILGTAALAAPRGWAATHPGGKQELGSLSKDVRRASQLYQAGGGARSLVPGVNTGFTGDIRRLPAQLQREFAQTAARGY